MAKIGFLLYFLIMDYFKGVEWVGFNHLPDLSIWKEKTFDDYWVLDYAHSGAVDFGMGADPLVRLEAPVAWLTFPGPRFRFGRTDGGIWDHYFAAFRGPRVASYLSGGLYPMESMPPFRPISDAEQFRNGFMELLSELERPDRNEPRAVHLLEGLLLQYSNPGEPRSSDDPRQEAIRALSAAIWQDPARPVDFETEARRAGLSVPHFRRLFIRLLGHPPQRYLLKARLEAAARLLRNTDREIKSVARETGFEDLFHFAKMFRKYQGLPPGKYREGRKLF